MKNIEQKKLDAKNYINNSSKHLFILNDTFIYKIIEFQKDGNQYYAKLTINEKNVSLDIINHNNYKWELKAHLFPQYVKTKSIPYFKKMREMVKMIESEISLTDNKSLIEKIKNNVKDLELVKQ